MQQSRLVSCKIYIQCRYLVFDPPGLGTRPGYTLWFGLVPRPGGSKTRHWYCIWLGCCMRANSMYEISSNQPSLVACPGLMWCATGLRFYYIGDTDPESKLAIGIGHLWSWAGFMAAHIWAINFAINYELHQYSGDNNEPICCPKCSFKLIWPYLVSCYLLMTQLRPLRQPVITL